MYYAVCIYAIILHNADVLDGRNSIGIGDGKVCVYGWRQIVQNFELGNVWLVYGDSSCGIKESLLSLICVYMRDLIAYAWNMVVMRNFGQLPIDPRGRRGGKNFKRILKILKRFKYVYNFGLSIQILIKLQDFPIVSEKQWFDLLF